MFWTDRGRNNYVDGFRAAIDMLSVHTAFPALTGLNEATGGSYARAAPSIPPAAAGLAVNNALTEINLAAGTYLFLGFWDTTPLFLGATPFGNKRPRPVTYTTTGNFFGEVSHGLTAGTPLVAYDAWQAGLPAGMVEGTVYYVINPTTDQFQLALTVGGSAIAPTTSTVLVLKEVVPLVIPPGGGKAAFDISTLVLDGTLV